MPRLKQAGREAGNETANRMFDFLFGDKDPIQQPGSDTRTATGTPGNWWTVFNIVPDAFNHTLDGFRFYQSKSRKLSAKLRELGQTRVGYTVGSKFVYSQHCKASRLAGLSEEQIQAIAHWSTANCYDETEKAVLAYVDALALQHGRVSDELFARLKELLSDEEILELTYVSCTYLMHAVMSKALRLEFDDMDDPIQEVPSPDSETRDLYGNALKE